MNSNNIPINRKNEDYKVVNNNGRKLIEMCKCQELCIVNGRIGSDKSIGQKTCDNKSTIDYVICTPDLFPDIADFTVDNFCPLISDKHNPIHTTINTARNRGQISNSNAENQTSDIQTHHMTCNWDNSKKDEFQKSFNMSKVEELDLKLSALSLSEINQNCIENISMELKNILLEPATTTGMYKRRKKNPKTGKAKMKKTWFNADCRTSKKNYMKFKKSLSKPLNDSDRAALKKASKQHKKLLRKIKRRYGKSFNHRLRNLKKYDPRELWRVLNDDCKSNRTGNISTEIALNHFRELGKNNAREREILLENPNQNENEDVNQPFDDDEVSNHINHLKNSKSPGIDYILNEFIKNCPEELIPVITKFFNIILVSGIIPNEWTTGIIKALYKNKGDINDINNYRGITLLSCLGKLFTSVINSRLYNYLTNEGILGNEQAGFRPKHSTLDHIFALQVLSSYYISEKKQLFCAFVDYSKAFDFIDRTYLWQKLLNSNINGKVFNVIKSMYENAKSHISINNNLSEAFPCQVGVRQGENLSPLLFAIYLNDFESFLNERYDGLTKISSSILNELNIYFKIFCLLYADDTLVLAESATQLQNALNGLHAYCNMWSLKVNIEKTKVVIFSRGKIRKYKTFKFGENSIDVVSDYVYLGTTFNYNGKFNKAKSKQVLQARKATYSLLTKAKKLDLATDVFTELFERLVIPILLYGSEVWGYECSKQLEVMYNKVMRSFLKLHKTTPMCMVKGELDLKDISEYIENRMLNFWYNVATGEENKISSILYKWVKILYDQNSFKSPWLDKIKTTLDHLGMSYLFNSASSVDKDYFKKSIKLRLSDIHNQNWSDSVSSNSVCINYRMMTEHKKLQSYLLKLPDQYMFALCKLKFANHKMPLVNGRYANIPAED